MSPTISIVLVILPGPRSHALTHPVAFPCIRQRRCSCRTRWRRGGARRCRDCSTLAPMPPRRLSRCLFVLSCALNVLYSWWCSVLPLLYLMSLCHAHGHPDQTCVPAPLTSTRSPHSLRPPQTVSQPSLHSPQAMLVAAAPCRDAFAPLVPHLNSLRAQWCALPAIDMTIAQISL